jgi:hypothetical protein
LLLLLTVEPMLKVDPAAGDPFTTLRLPPRAMFSLLLLTVERKLT